MLFSPATKLQVLSSINKIYSFDLCYWTECKNSLCVNTYKTIICYIWTHNMIFNTAEYFNLCERMAFDIIATWLTFHTYIQVALAGHLSVSQTLCTQSNQQFRLLLVKTQTVAIWTGVINQIHFQTLWHVSWRPMPWVEYLAINLQKPKILKTYRKYIWNFNKHINSLSSMVVKIASENQLICTSVKMKTSFPPNTIILCSL